MKILIAGDLCPQLRVAEMFDKNEFGAVLGEVKPIIEQADYSIVNFECPICYGEEKPISKWGPNLMCSEKGIEAVKWVGFNCVTLANNHFLDYGEQGVLNTLNVCKNNGLDVVGGGKNIVDASLVLYKELNGKKLAVINCCEHEFSIATESTAGSCPLNPINQYYKIKEARKNADYVLVIIHGGHEHFQLPSPRMQETYRFFIDAGADAVVNHHQHCYSGYEFYQGKPIFYGIGNFCFDDNNGFDKKWTEGYLVLLDFSLEKTEVSLYPYCQCSFEPKVELLDRHSFDKQLQLLNDTIVTPFELRTAINNYYCESKSLMSAIFEPLYNRFFFALRRRKLIPSMIGKKRQLEATDIIMCESHIDKLRYYLVDRLRTCFDN